MARLVITEFLKNRSAAHYKLQLPVIFKWTHGGEMHMGAGFTCDVAIDGAVILSSVCPPLGCDIQVELLIPCIDTCEDQVRVQCLGKVTPPLYSTSAKSFAVKGLFDDRHIISEVER